jgi:hypothetical protein
VVLRKYKHNAGELPSEETCATCWRHDLVGGMQYDVA